MTSTLILLAPTVVSKLTDRQLRLKLSQLLPDDPSKGLIAESLPDERLSILATVGPEWSELLERELVRREFANLDRLRYRTASEAEAAMVIREDLEDIFRLQGAEYGMSRVAAKEGKLLILSLLASRLSSGDIDRLTNMARADPQQQETLDWLLAIGGKASPEEVFKRAVQLGNLRLVDEMLRQSTLSEDSLREMASRAIADNQWDVFYRLLQEIPLTDELLKSAYVELIDQLGKPSPPLNQITAIIGQLRELEKSPEVNTRAVAYAKGELDKSLRMRSDAEYIVNNRQIANDADITSNLMRWLVKHGDVELVDKAIKASISPLFHLAPMQQAIFENNWEMFDLLLPYQGKQDLLDMLPDIIQEERPSMLQVTVDKLNRQYPGELERKAKGASKSLIYTMMHDAVGSGLPELVQFMLDHYAVNEDLLIEMRELANRRHYQMVSALLDTL